VICLGIESTAHTFGVGLVEGELDGPDGFKILSDAKDVYRAPEGSGIHPREASRHHVETCSKVLETAMTDAGMRMDDIGFIAYSAGPGLGPCLRVGAVVARSLALYFRKPLVPANHAIGHIVLGKMLTGLDDPLVLIVSGGHTALAASQKAEWKIFGETLDLTLGQLLDQLGRFMGLSSPAGSQIEKMAQSGSNELVAQLPYTIKGNDVSYSGLLSAAKDFLNSGKGKSDVCFAIQEVAFSILTEATERALSFTGKRELLVTGGVAANARLSEMLSRMCEARSARSQAIPGKYAGDCGAQIAAAGFGYMKNGYETDPRKSFVSQSWRIDRADLTPSLVS
jgi:N6-L-threonylcarbamoyladenine synthase